MFKHKNKFLILMILMLFITISSISAQDTSNLATDNIDDISAADQPSIQLSDSGSSSNVLGVGENNDILGGQDPNLIFNPANNTTINYGEAFAITITGPSNLCELNISVDDGQPFKLAFNGNVRITNFDLPSLGAGDHTLTIKYPANGDYDEQSYTYKIAVTGKEVPITVEDVKIIYGQTATIVATGLSEIKGENITIEIEGKGSKVVQVDDNGNATAVFDGLAAGNYTITASYAGSGPYLPNSTTANLTVDKANTTLDITFDPELIYDGDTVIFNFTVDKNATGTINFKINDGKTRKAVISDGAAVYTINAKAGDYNITASYAGDDNFNSAKASIKLTVNAAPEIEVAADDITYGDNAVIAVTIPEGVTGDLTVTVGNYTYDDGFTYLNGVAYLSIEDLDAGKYDVIAEYGGLTDETSFTVDKANTTLDIIVDGGEPVYAGETVVIYFEVDPAATGTISYTINGGKTHTKTIENGVVVFTKDNVKANTYEIVASYSGDDNFNEADAFTTIIVDVAPEIEVAANNITYGDDAVITVTIPEDVTGDLTITVGDTIYTKGFVEVDDNVYQLTISDLDAGKYDVIAEYGGLTDETSFTVDKANTTLDIIVDGGEPVYAGDTVIIYFKVNNTATGTITYTINGGKTHGDDIEEGVVVFTKTNVKANTYEIVASYSGDDNFNEADAFTTIIVDVAPEIEVSADDITYGEIAEIIVALPEGVTGDLTVTVGDITYTEFIFDDDAAYLYIEDLDAGYYEVTAEYGGLTDETSFTVDKANTTLDIIVNGGEPVYVGDDVVIYFEVDPAATGTISYTINGGKTHTKTIENGVVVFTKDNVKANTYEIVASYSGDDNFNEAEANLTITIDIEPVLFVTAENITYNESEAIITVILPYGAFKEDLTIIVNDTVYYAKDFVQEENIVYLSIAGLNAGRYDVQAQFLDAPSSLLINTTEFYVFKAASFIEIEVDDTYYVGDEVVITFIPSTDSTIFYSINGEYEIAPANKTITLTAVNGTYVVTAFLDADENHNVSEEVSATFAVYKLTPEIDVLYFDEYVVGTDVDIVVYGPEDPTAELLIEGAGLPTNHTDAFDGEYEVSYGNNLGIGEYTLTVTYYENDKYVRYSTTVTFNVIDREDTILYIDSIDTNKTTDVTTIDITITDAEGSPFDISGNVTVYVYNGDEVVSIVQSDELDSCKFTLDLGVIEPGEYNFTAVYSGNTYYKESNATKVYEVPKVSEYPISVEATNIVYNETEVIIAVTLPSGAKKDNLTVIVNNVVYRGDDFDQYDDIVYLSIAGLDVGDYDVEVTYIDDVYGYLTNTTNFTVSPAESSIEIIVDTVYYVDDTVYILLVPSIDNGEIYVYINDEEQIVTDNTVTIEKAVFGNYTVEAFLIGDINHNDSYDEAEFTVLKLNPAISADYEFEYMVGTEAYITIYGPADRNGTMLIYGNSTDITFAFDGEYRFSLGNDSEIGDYKFEIMYLENDKYYTDSIDVEFSVIDRYGTDLTIDSIVTDKTNNITTIGITITDADGYPFDISGNVTVYIYDDEGLVNEVTSDELVNCKFTVDLGEIDPGEYEFVAVYNGNTYYKGSADGKDYEVPLVSNYELPVYVEDIIYDETATICVILPDRADKDYLVIIVDNTVYSSEEYDQYENIVTLDVTGLDAGEHTVSVLYKDDVYDLQQNATEFDVDPAESSIEIEVDGYYFVDDEIVITLIPSIDDGEIVVLINGEEYEVIDNTVTLTAVYGNYTVEAFLIGDDNHYDSEDDAEFEVYKLEPQIDVDYLDEYMVGTEISIVVYGPDDRIGTILINGNFTEFNDEFIGDYEFSLSENAEIGDYTIKVTYYGNDKYVEESMEIEFTVIDRFETDLTIDSITTDKTNNITSIGISITDAEGYPFAISGNVTVYIYDEYGDLVGEVTSDADTCKVTIDLGEIDPGNYEFEAIYSGNTDYKDSSDVKDYEVPLVSNYELPVYASDIIYNQTAAIIAVIVPDRADKDYLTIIVDNTVYSSEEYTQYANIVTLFVPGLDAGDHIVKVQYKDDVYDLKENTTSFTVIPAASSIEIVVDSVYFVDDEIVITLIPSIDDGEIIVYINGEPYEVEDNTVTLTAVYGDYTVEAYLIGDKNHNDSSADAEFTVLKLDPEVSVNFTENHAGYNIPVIVTLPEDATGMVFIEVNDGIYAAYAKNGTANITIPSMDAGNYTAKVTYQGDDKYNQFTENMTLNVENYYELNVPDVVKYYRGGERLYVYALFNGKAAAEETVTIIINGISYTKKTDKNGVASLAINLNSGNYSVRVKWNDLEANSTVEVKPTIDGHNVAKVFKNDTQYYATFYDSNGDVLANKIVTFNINGVFYNRTTDENGVAKLNINLNPGEYIITAINPVTQEMISNNISVLSHFIEHDDLEKIYGSATPFVVRLCNDRGQIADAGELVKFNVNGVMYEKLSDIDGFVKLNINLQPGQYIITSYYKDESVSNIITVRSE